jgi:hypothetical protein
LDYIKYYRKNRIREYGVKINKMEYIANGAQADVYKDGYKAI